MIKIDKNTKQLYNIIGIKYKLTYSEYKCYSLPHAYNFT